VIRKQANSDLQVARPFRAFWRSFAALSILVAGTAPFIDTVPSRWLFLFAGLGYCAALSFFALGICLLPDRISSRALVGFVACPFLTALIKLAIFLSARSGHVGALDWIFPVAFCALGIMGGLLLALAFYGWYHRLTSAASAPHSQ
jgi:hypothetical protein